MKYFTIVISFLIINLVFPTLTFAGLPCIDPPCTPHTFYPTNNQTIILDTIIMGLYSVLFFIITTSAVGMLTEKLNVIPIKQHKSIIKSLINIMKYFPVLFWILFLCLDYWIFGKDLSSSPVNVYKPVNNNILLILFSLIVVGVIQLFAVFKINDLISNWIKSIMDDKFKPTTNWLQIFKIGIVGILIVFLTYFISTILINMFSIEINDFNLP